MGEVFNIGNQDEITIDDLAKEDNQDNQERSTIKHILRTGLRGRL